MNRYFRSELGSQCEELFSTSDDRVFIRVEEAVKYVRGELGTKPLEDQTILMWYEGDDGPMEVRRRVTTVVAGEETRINFEESERWKVV